MPTRLVPKSPLSVQFDDSSDLDTQIDGILSEPRRFLRKAKSTSRLADTSDLIDFLRTTGPEDHIKRHDPHAAGSFFRRPSTPRRDALTLQKGMSSSALDQDVKKSSSAAFWKKPKLAALFGRKADDNQDMSPTFQPKMDVTFPQNNATSFTTRYSSIDVDYDQCLGEQPFRHLHPIPFSLDARMEYIDTHMLPPLSNVQKNGPPVPIPARSSSHSRSGSEQSVHTGTLHKRRSSALADTIVQSVHRSGHSKQQTRLEAYDQVLNNDRFKERSLATSPTQSSAASPFRLSDTDSLQFCATSPPQSSPPRISKMRPVSIDLLENIVLINQWEQQDDPPRARTAEAKIETRQLEEQKKSVEATKSSVEATSSSINTADIAPLKIEKKTNSLERPRCLSAGTIDRPSTHLLIQENKLEEYIRSYSLDSQSTGKRISDGGRMFATELSLSGCLPSEEELTDMALRQRLASFKSEPKRTQSKNIQGWDNFSSSSLARTSTLGSELSFARKRSLNGVSGLRRKADSGIAERLKRLLDDSVEQESNKRPQPPRRHVQVQTSPVQKASAYTQTQASDLTFDNHQPPAESLKTVDLATPLGISFLDLDQLKRPFKFQEREPKERPCSPPPRMELPSIPPATPPQHEHTSSVSSSTQTPPVTPVGPQTRDQDVTVIDVGNPYESLAEESKQLRRDQRNSFNRRASSINTLSSSPDHSMYHTPATEPSAFFLTDNFEQEAEQVEHEERQQDHSSSAILENQHLLSLVKHLRTQLEQEKRARQRLGAAFDDSRDKYEKLSMNAYMTIQGLLKQRSLLFEEVLSLRDGQSQYLQSQSQN